MRIACRVFVLLSLGLLGSCGPPVPSETVQLSRPSDFDTPLDNRWRKASETRPIAILLGRAETTRILMPRRAVLRVSCYRRPIVRVSYDVGLASGPIAVAYRFDSKTVQKGVVRVRGRHRNMLVIDNTAAATAFQADLRSSSTLKVRASRPPFDMHDAYFRWDRNDKILNEVLAACNTRMLDAARQRPAAGPDDDDDTEDDIKDVLSEQ
jgi:hypothetical protein